MDLRPGKPLPSPLGRSRAAKTLLRSPPLAHEVVFSSGERREAKLVGADADSDLAVLKVDALPEGVGPLPLVDADSVQVGQIVVAIGSPFGVEGSMSMGIISGLGRSLRAQRAGTVGSSYTLNDRPQGAQASLGSCVSLTRKLWF